MKPAAQGTKGILNAEAGKRKFRLERYEPSEDLTFAIELIWTVVWDLRGEEPYDQTILSYPSVNLTFEADADGIFAGVYGVPENTYTRHLRDEGWTLGVKFRPGGFYPFWRKPVSDLTGQRMDLKSMFGDEGAALAEQVLADRPDTAKQIERVEQFLRERLTERDEEVGRIGRMVEAVIADRSIVKVEDMAERFGLQVRSLQRLFNRYVGVSPKWVIQRYRLQEAADLMERGETPDWPALAQELGYYDQAHFIKDFKSVIGKAPESYIKNLQPE
ncbi:helix-turn-helix domain-containing protein [Cohnella candidum]|uniref:AraC family transcriptional regulator n=1 Tax=Cohnella candidum TaxID=2674991 RepID=A0A3G3K0T9_9BACL|nr:AraC family transcriptional regulator [Cohnella candidum]AYQ73761.1 AraC family transcriptional regulator [Cohnella candidum]